MGALMARSDLKRMTIDELVDRFVAIGMNQDLALDDDEISKFNCLFDQMEAIKSELKQRPGDQRSTLVRPYDHPNMQVQLKAAKATLAVVPEAARRKLEEVANSGRFPQAGDAGMSLWKFDRGVSNQT
jgi:hypothetical protein